MTVHVRACACGCTNAKERERYEKEKKKTEKGSDVDPKGKKEPANTALMKKPYHRLRCHSRWIRRGCPIRYGFAIIRIRATKSLARNTVSFSSS